MALYSEIVMDHFTHPRNVGVIENADGIKVIKNYADGKIMIAENTDDFGHRNILCSLPLLSIDEIYNVIESANVKIQGTKNTTVYANNKFIAYFANEDASFTLCLPRGDEAVEVFENKKYKNGEKITLNRGRCKFFML